MTESEKYKLSTYQSIELLHKTETAVVELVECSLDGKRYVKKTYPSDRRTVFRCLSEITSPFLPEIKETFFGEDTVVIEEYIEGVTLEQLLSESHSFGKGELLLLFESLLSSLSALHEKGLVHRDIKPGNIIVKEDGRAVLIDFSIARPYAKNRSSDTELLGTVGYAAPEQFGFSQSDYRTDIYALGVTLKGLSLKRGIPKYVLKAIHRCAAFDPSNRFQSIGEIRKYLRRSRQKGFVGVAALTVAVLTALVIGAVQMVPEPQKEEPPISVQLPKAPITAVQPPETSETPSTIIPTPTEKKEEPAALLPPKEEESLSPLRYESGSSRIVNTDEAGSLVPCLPLPTEGVYKTKIRLGEAVDEVPIEVVAAENRYTVTVNHQATFVFSSTYTPPAYDYPNGKVLAELLFYDLNGDGLAEIIPILCDAYAVRYGEDAESTLLRNYSQGWCIYFNGTEYVLAEGEMLARYEPFRIIASYSGHIMTDFPNSYVLQENAVVLK